jgi:hypothetical protein
VKNKTNALFHVEDLDEEYDPQHIDDTDMYEKHN